MKKNICETGSEIYINREQSWLRFNKRVLLECVKPSNPFFEQLKFMSIYSDNLDEFFMIRIGTLFDQMLIDKTRRDNKTGMTNREQIDAAMELAREIAREKDKLYKTLVRKLSAEGIRKVNLNKLSVKELSPWKKYFTREMLPVLSPQIIDKRHPYPFLRGLEHYIYVSLKEKNGSLCHGIVPVGGQLNRVVWSQDKTEFVLAEELICRFADLLFGRYKVQEKTVFRVTRNADINLDEGVFDYDTDYKDAMSELLKKRRKLAPVRLQLSSPAGDALKNHLAEQLKISKNQIFTELSPLDLTFLSEIADRFDQRSRPELFYRKLEASKAPKKLYETVGKDKKDASLFHPFQSFANTVELLNAAADDPSVVSIKMTLYRTARDSKIVDALVRAAESGKEVLAVVELRARFDEENNIESARLMENAGCTVIYGLGDYKVHSKLMLITKKHGQKLEYISYVGTGNFNEKTAALYTDAAIITADEQTAGEIAETFRAICCENLPETAGGLYVAPLGFKSRFIELVDREIEAASAGEKAEITIKCNSISDKDIIDRLVAASMAGVKVALYIRGICCLQSGIPGITDNIRVVSLVGRYLEHTRIFAFGPEGRREYFLSSGDFLTRNTERRIEAAIAVRDEEIKKRLAVILEYTARDNVNASILTENGAYREILPDYASEPFNSQNELFKFFNELDERERSGASVIKRLAGLLRRG